MHRDTEHNRHVHQLCCDRHAEKGVVEGHMQKSWPIIMTSQQNAGTMTTAFLTTVYYGPNR